MRNSYALAAWCFGLLAFAKLDAVCRDAAAFEITHYLSYFLLVSVLLFMSRNQPTSRAPRIAIATFLAAMVFASQCLTLWLAGLPGISAAQVLATLSSNILLLLAAVGVHGAFVAGTLAWLLVIVTPGWSHGWTDNPWTWLPVLILLLLWPLVALIESRVMSSSLRMGTRIAILAPMGLVSLSIVFAALAGNWSPSLWAYSSATITATAEAPVSSGWETYTLPVQVRADSEAPLMIVEKAEAVIDSAQGPRWASDEASRSTYLPAGHRYQISLKPPPEFAGQRLRIHGGLYLTSFHSPRVIHMGTDATKILPELGRCNVIRLGPYRDRVVCRTPAPGPDLVLVRFLNLKKDRPTETRPENVRDYSPWRLIPSLSPFAQISHPIPEEAGDHPDIQFTTWRRGDHTRAGFSIDTVLPPTTAEIR